MDIRLKNKKSILLYLVIIILLFSYGLGTTLELAGEVPQRLRGSYFNTWEFAAELEDFMNLFTETQLSDIDLDLEAAKQNIEIDPIEIEEYMGYNSYQMMEEDIAQLESGEIVSEETTTVEEARKLDQTEGEMTTEEKQTEKHNKIEEIKNKYTKAEEEARQIIKEKKVKELERQYQEINQKISRFQYKQSYIKYFMKDGLGKTYTNLKSGENYDTVEASSYFIRSFPYHTKRNDVLTSVNRFFITGEFTGFIAIPKADHAHSLIVENMYDYQDESTRFLILFGVGFVILSISLVLGFDFKKKYGLLFLEMVKFLEDFYNRFSIDIRIFTLVLNLLFIYAFNFYMVYGVYEWRIHRLFIYSGMISVFILQIIFLLPVFKSGQQFRTEWEKSFIIKHKDALQGSFLFKSLVVKILFILGVVSVLGIGLGIVLAEFGSEEILILFPIGLIPTIGVLIYIFRKVAYFNCILKYSEDLLEGRLNSEIPVKKRGLLSNLANNLNLLKQEIDHSQKVEQKSERLKTELISNVSHDLRTPLTSIMNYTEFLKDKNLSREEREKYIDIIDQKSKRLKVLIDDLFEVSKMATGNIELSLERVDIVQLMNQALAEYDEKIKESELHFKVTSSSPHIYVRVDGRKMWRVFDNIINNVLKYSLEKTRVYIGTIETDQNVVITFKNISNYELGENIDELLERFKRGDSSRNTEGSGLGLAIAKSIVDHHGGSLDIELDGDLFKTIVKINK